MIALLNSISPETATGILIVLAVILLSGMSVVHIEAARNFERTRR